MHGSPTISFVKAHRHRNVQFFILLHNFTLTFPRTLPFSSRPPHRHFYIPLNLAHYHRYK